MRHRSLIASFLLATLLLFSLPLVVTRGMPDQETTPGAKGPILEVGKYYTFYDQLSSRYYKILDKPRGNWVRVECQLPERSVECWVNLDRMVCIGVGMTEGDIPNIGR